MRSVLWIALTGLACGLYFVEGVYAEQPVSDGCKLVPAYSSAHGPTGFKVFAIIAGSYMERDGFKNGDLIEKMDGETVSDSAAVFAHSNVLGTRYTVLRKGKRIELRVTG